MPSSLDLLHKEVADLAVQGYHLYLRMALEVDGVDQKTKDEINKIDHKFLKEPFSLNFDGWYTKCLRLIRQVCPEREDDFVSRYKDSRRKSITYATYTISDFLMNLRAGPSYEPIATRDAALPKIEAQKNIVSGLIELIDSKVRDIKEIVSADLFDSELDAAENLGRRGFFRASGAMSGVVLERHLSQVAIVAGFTSRKANPSMSDFNDFLKSKDRIDTVTWRKIQHLADIRNLCDHPKDREPSKDDILELAEGVRRIVKNVL
jgi:hypothetical protein